MAKVFEGNLVGTGLKVAVIVARWNDFIGDRMLDGAIDAMVRHGVARDDIDIVKVPGSFELPLAAKKVAETGRYHAMVCLGVLIRGGTIHFDLIAGEATKGINAAALASGIPVGFGVITTETIEQAIERAGCKAGNKGAEAAMAAIEMANLFKGLDADA
jgi:6,7-dimethyl-8-ribityllumazine synthase